MVNLIRHDLEFILKQIKIAEANSSAHSGESAKKLTEIRVDADGNVVATGGTLAVPTPLSPYGLRTVDGGYNNLVEGRDEWGASDTPFEQVTNPYWRNEQDDQIVFGTPQNSVTMTNNNYGNSGNVVDADPRIISNLIVDQSLDNPAAIYAALTYAGVTGAALLPTIEAIRDAKEALDAAIANAASEGTGIPALQQALAQAQAEAAQAQAAADAAQLEAEADQTAHEEALAAVQLADAEADQALSALTAFLTDGVVPDELQEGYAEALATFLAKQTALSDAETLATSRGQEAQDSADAAQAAADIAAEKQTDRAEAQQALSNAEAANSAADAAVVTAQNALDDLLDTHGVVVDNGSVVLPNVAPDEGLSAPYNSWFTLFGQFFDHGLDLVPKGGNGTVYIPLQEDDPLYNPNSPHTNFMVLTRAPANPDNLTTPWVDQNQTYSSHASKQLFMREYAVVDGKPLATGMLLEGSKGGLATWADVKTQAREVLGINLTDADVTNIPMFVMDAYGEFVRGPGGFPQMVVSLGADNKFGGEGANADVFVEGNPANPISTANALRTGHAFLDDIAHAAGPRTSTGVMLSQDADDAAGYAGGYDSRGNQTSYDNELLDAHYITGDGRGNENIGLTAVHHVFHSEHNHTVEQVKTRAIESGDVKFLNEWLRVPLAENTVLPNPADAAAVKAFASTLAWDGERLFQAARFTTEMQYQHLVFEEFARKVQPDVDAFVFQPSMDIDPAIFAEFAHVVYRFGHSMLRETVDQTNADGTTNNLDLFEAFLNPLAFGADGLNHAQAAGAIVRGMTSQVGNEIDEFVTGVLRNQLLGIPLDLAALNIARGRETGIPPLNEARRQFKEIASGDTQLDAYTSWTDFMLNLKNPASIVNFIAAYGTHLSITSATTAEAKREAAWKIVFGGEGAPEDRLAFLNATGAYAGGKLGGLEDVDLWVGGMAEKKMAFGGMLGSTFSFIFELQLENLQNADRFYYLSRVQGLNFLNELENNSLAKMVLNNTDLGQTGYALPGDIFSTPDHVLYVDKNVQTMFGHTDPTHDDPFLAAISKLVERVDTNGDGIAELIRYNGNDHVLIQGTNGNDRIVAGGGDDSVWGRDGNDTIEAGYGVDKIHGGKGDDIITNSGTDIGEVDMLHGEEGNDVIHGGSGLALVFGNEGQDFIMAGPDGKEVFGGTGNDFILGGDGGDFLLGNEGDDWIEAGNGFDTTAGDNSDLNFNSSIIGHDVMFAGQNEHDFDAESGDDIMVQGESVMRNEGMFGYDWAIHKLNGEAADSDLLTPIFTTEEEDILRDRFDQVEALSGWKHDDVLRGDNRGDPDAEVPPAGANGDAVESFFTDNELTQAGVNRIAGLRELLGNLVAAAPTSGDLEKVIAYNSGNILIGGGGSDTIEGRGGDDVIDGDAWLNVRIRITTSSGVFTADGMTGKVYREADYADGAPKPGAVAQFGGQSLQTLMLNATLNPGQLSIVREIVDGDLNNSATDVAVYGDVRANYSIRSNADGSITVEHVTQGIDPATGNPRLSDGTDRLLNIEKLRFADGEVSLTPPKLSLHAFNPGGTHADTFSATSYSQSNGNRPWASNWIETGDDGSPAFTNGGQIQITGGALRFDTGDGAMIERGLNLAGVGTARVAYSVAEQGFDANERVEVYFSRDGVTFDLLEVIGENADGGTRGFDISGPFTSGAKIRFVVTGVAGNNELVNIDNVAVSVMIASPNPTINYATTFQEGGQSVAIANNPGIVDDATQMVSARIVLTNAQPDDELNVGALPDGITANVATVAGQIIVTLSGPASLAAYQRAIQSVTFDNDSQNPVAGSRVIQVTVNDGLLDSNAATTTINVVAVNDPPNAQNDIVFTNVTTGPFLIPEWALLANDTDVEGDTLDITAVNGNNAFQTSLTANPGSVTLTDIGNPGGTFSYTASDGKGGFDTTTVNVTRDTLGDVEGNQFDNILIGNASGSTFDGSTGNDTILAGGGNDTIVWNANNNGATDGTDFVDGGSGTDTFDLNTRPGQSEIYRVYTRAEAVDRGVPVTRDETEIVITRTVGNTTAVVAELDNIEEIRIGTQTSDPSNGSAGNGDTVQIFGDFSTTSLALNTITINGNAGDDTVDISGLTSAHRIVFRSRGGNDTIVGTLRPQDVIELEPGRKVEEYEWEEHEDGSTTITCGVHQVTFRCAEGVQPTLAEVPATPVPETPVEPVTPTDPGMPTNPGTLLEPQAAADLALRGSSRSEALWGGDGHDRMDGGRGHDKLFGGMGNDRLRGGDGHDHLDGGSGADRMWGGRGNDVYIVDDRGDRVFEGRGHGIDTVKASVSYSLSGTHVERLMLTGSEDINGTGNGLDNLLRGNSGSNVLKGGRGDDTLRGMSGDDVLNGGAGDDRLTGGSGADTFVFQKGGGRDVVSDFRHGEDDIDVSRLNGVNSLSDLDIRQEGGNTLIEHGNSVLVLKGVNASDLDSNDFIF